MRILHTTATYPPSVNGVAYQIQLLAQTARKSGHQVRVLAPNHPYAPPKEPGIIRYRSFSNPFTDNYPIGIPLFPQEKLDQFKPDIVHTHHPFYIGYIAAYIANQNHCPLFFTHHTSYQQYISTYLPIGAKLTQTVFRGHLKDLSGKVHTIICPSQYIQDQLKQQNIHNTSVIPNGIDVQNFTPTPRKPKTLNLIYTGRLSKEKSPQKLITLAQHLKNKAYPFHLTIVGSGKMAPKIKKLVKKHNLQTQTTLTGTIERQKLPSLLKKHHFFISYSTTEVMTLTIIEAQASGLPALVPTNASHPMLFNSKNSLKLDNNYQKAAKQIIDLFENKPLLKRMSLQSHKDAKKYAIEATTNAYLELYQAAR